MSTTSSPNQEQKSCFDYWCKPEKNSSQQLKDRTEAVRICYDHDVRQITRIFGKQRTPNSPTDYSLSIDDLKETIDKVTEIIKDATGKLAEYDTKCTHVLATLDRMGSKTYSYLQKGLAGVGVTGAAASVFNVIKKDCSNTSTGAETNSSAPSAVGAIGIALVVASFSLNWMKEYVDGQKKEQRKFTKIIEDNTRMQAAHKASIIMLNTLQLSYEEGMAQHVDPVQHAEQKSHDLSSELELALTERIFKDGLTIPDHLKRACAPESIKRAMINRGTSLKSTVAGFSSAATPANSPQRREEEEIFQEIELQSPSEHKQGHSSAKFQPPPSDL